MVLSNATHSPLNLPFSPSSTTPSTSTGLCSTLPQHSHLTFSTQYHLFNLPFPYDWVNNFYVLFWGNNSVLYLKLVNSYNQVNVFLKVLFPNVMTFRQNPPEIIILSDESISFYNGLKIQNLDKFIIVFSSEKRLNLTIVFQQWSVFEKEI